MAGFSASGVRRSARNHRAYRTCSHSRCRGQVQIPHSASSRPRHAPIARFQRLVRECELLSRKRLPSQKVPAAWGSDSFPSKSKLSSAGYCPRRQRWWLSLPLPPGNRRASPVREMCRRSPRPVAPFHRSLRRVGVILEPLPFSSTTSGVWAELTWRYPLIPIDADIQAGDDPVAPQALVDRSTSSVAAALAGDLCAAQCVLVVSHRVKTHGAG